MPSSRLKPTEDEWLRYKADIRRLYLIDDIPLKELVGKVGELGLVVTSVLPTHVVRESLLTVIIHRKAQLEYQLKKWEFKKNMDKSTWLYVGHRVEKRKRQQKKSEVIYNGKRLKPSTIETETERHRDKSTFARLVPGESKRVRGIRPIH